MNLQLLCMQPWLQCGDPPKRNCSPGSTGEYYDAPNFGINQSFSFKRRRAISKWDYDLFPQGCRLAVCARQDRTRRVPVWQTFNLELLLLFGKVWPVSLRAVYLQHVSGRIVLKWYWYALLYIHFASLFVSNGTMTCFLRVVDLQPLPGRIALKWHW